MIPESINIDNIEEKIKKLSNDFKTAREALIKINSTPGCQVLFPEDNKIEKIILDINIGKLNADVI